MTMGTGISLETKNQYNSATEMLISGAKSGHLSHALIFEGSKDSQKLSLAMELSRIIIGGENLENEMDYSFITKDEMKIETIRKINQDCIKKSYRGSKVYVIEDAMKLSIPMQNAFLKTLEEPPPNVYFILLCENSMPLLETIKSRCEKYYFHSEEEIRQETKYLSKIEEFYRVLKENDTLGAIGYMDHLKEAKDDIELVFDMLLDYTRDILVTKEKSDYLSYRISDKDFTEEMASSFTHFQLLSILDIIEDTRKKISSRCNYNLTCEAMVLNILEVIK